MYIFNTGEGLRCFCSPCHEGIDVNETCLAPPNSMCFASIKAIFENGERIHELVYGCLPSFEGGTTMQVQIFDNLCFFKNNFIDCLSLEQGYYIN